MNLSSTNLDAVSIHAGGASWTLQSYACDLCGSVEHAPIARKRGRVTGHEFTVVRCRSCRFIFVNPRIVDDQIGRLYDENYYRGDGFDANVRYDDFELAQTNARALEQIVATVAEALRKTSGLSGVSCLDVGCGSGALVAALARTGADALGQDSSQQALALARQRNVRVVSQSVEELLAAKPRYDVVTAIEVIEHVPHPTAFARSLAALLAPGGLLLLGTGNWNVVRWMPSTPYVMPEGHLQYFTPATLGRLYDLAGLTARSSALNGTWTFCRLASRFGVGAARSLPIRLLGSATRAVAPAIGPMPLALKAPA